MPKTPKTTASKALRGNPGKRPIAEPAHLSGVPRPPDSLSAEALPEWDRIVGLLAARGDLSELDQAGLADYCLCRLRLDQCEASIEKDGILVPGQRGMVKNPAMQLARQYRAALAKWAELFGLTPASRTRISTPKPETDDDPDGMFGGKGAL